MRHNVLRMAWSRLDSKTDLAIDDHVERDCTQRLLHDGRQRTSEPRFWVADADERRDAAGVNAVAAWNAGNEADIGSNASSASNSSNVPNVSNASNDANCTDEHGMCGVFTSSEANKNTVITAIHEN